MQEFSAHNHSDCIQSSLQSLEQYCADKNLKLTPTRQRVMEILASEHKAIGAYKILEHLQSDGAAPQPPIVYRALDFLVTHGFAHKVEGLNAFIACSHPGKEHNPTFLICRSCDTIAETQHTKLTATKGFKVESATIELSGLCAECDG